MVRPTDEGGEEGKGLEGRVSRSQSCPPIPGAVHPASGKRQRWLRGSEQNLDIHPDPARSRPSDPTEDPSVRPFPCNRERARQLDPDSPAALGPSPARCPEFHRPKNPPPPPPAACCCCAAPLACSRSPIFSLTRKNLSTHLSAQNVHNGRKGAKEDAMKGTERIDLSD